MFNDRNSPRGANQREQQRIKLRLEREEKQRQRERAMERSQKKLNVAIVIQQGDMFVIQLKQVNDAVTRTHPFTAAQLLKKGAGYYEYFDPASKTRFDQLKENHQKNSAAQRSASPQALSPVSSPRSQFLSSASSSGFYSRGNAAANPSWQMSGVQEQGRRAGAARPS